MVIVLDVTLKPLWSFWAISGSFWGHFKIIRPKPAYGRQGLEWIVGPGYSFVVFSTVGQSDHFLCQIDRQSDVTHGGIQRTF